MLKIRRHAALILVILALLLINIAALNWNRRLFADSGGNALLRYGERMPRLRGPGYAGRQITPVGAGDVNLVIYLSGPYLNSQAISLLKSGEIFQREHAAKGLRVSLVTAGALREVEELLRDKLISYQVVNDEDGSLAKELGLAAGDSGTFLFDRAGSCRFSVRQPIGPGDLRQLLAAEGVAPADASAARPAHLATGKPLPPWKLSDARTLARTNVLEVTTGRPRLLVFFPADCFSCGSPDVGGYLSEFNYWRRAGKAGDAEPLLIFDSAFTREAVLRALEYSKVESPAYISEEELSTLSRLTQTKGETLGRLVLVRTDAPGAVVSVSRIRRPGGPPAGDEARAGEGAGNRARSLRRVLDNPDLDIYDVDSYKGLYVASDRARNSIVVLDEGARIQTEIGGIGSAPGKVFRPGYLDVADDGAIYVQDGGNERIQSFDIAGRYLGGFDASPYMGFAAGTGGEVYLGQPEKGKLVSVYSREGKLLRSFGALKTFAEVYGADYAQKNETYRTAINRVRLTTDGEGNILVSFMLAPIIQKYTRRGELVFEKRLEGPEVERLAEMVANDSGESYFTMSMDGFPERVMALEATALPGGEINVLLTDGSVYVADAEGRRLRVLRPQAAEGFTPDMTGASPGGELLVVALAPRRCYLVPRQAE
jgi:hypothetical protein